MGKIGDRQQARVRHPAQDRPLTSPHSSPSSSPFSIFVANLTYDTNNEDLLRIFGRYGKLADVFIPWDHSRNRSRGFAFIRFLYEQDARNAAGCLNGKRIDGRVVSIAWAKRQLKTSTTEKAPSWKLQPHHTSTTAFPGLAKKSFAQATSSPIDPSSPPADGFPSDPFTVETDGNIVIRLKKSLSHALVATAENENISILQLIDRYRLSTLAASHADFTRIGPNRFLIKFQSDEEKSAFKADLALIRRMGLIGVEPWSPNTQAFSSGVWIRLLGIPAHAWYPEAISKLAQTFGIIEDIDSVSSLGVFQAFARVRVKLSPGSDFNRPRSLRVNGISFPIVGMLEKARAATIESIPPQVNKQKPREKVISTRDWVLKSFHTVIGPPAGCPTCVRENDKLTVEGQILHIRPQLLPGFACMIPFNGLI